MIVPMKKVCLFIRGEEKEASLRALRKLGLIHIEQAEGSGERLAARKEQAASLESTLFVLAEQKAAEQKPLNTEQALELAQQVAALGEEKKQCQAQLPALQAELDRLKGWGEIDPDEIAALAAQGVELSFYELPKSAYHSLPQSLQTVMLAESKSSVKFLCYAPPVTEDEALAALLSAARLLLPQQSTAQLRRQIHALEARVASIDETLCSYGSYTDGVKKALQVLQQEIEFETYATGMASERLSSDGAKEVSVAYFTGYIEAEQLGRLKRAAAENAWGLMAEDPCEEDNVPTKLKNNKFVSLIYPLTDFLGTVPGYFEYDISGWFLAFILIFFGIIFGDGAYGLLICAIAAVPLIRSLRAKKSVSPTVLLIGLFGLSTVLWGTLTCTWCGLPAEKLPQWLQGLSIPVISNVHTDTLWTLPWTAEGVGLTTSQNLQIFCFTLALVQLTLAHIKGVVRNRHSVQMLGDVGSIMQLVGIYYLVLSLVVNPAVFTFDLVLGGIPVGTVSIALIGVGFALSFVFSNYEGSIVQSILTSLKNIVSVLLGVVNMFSDIVSYIRLWAVGLAGAAISATVNELAGPLLGNFLFMIVAIFLLIFGHGLNMILNVLSVIVHGIRLNTLEFSSHLGMSWSGHKFKPFKEHLDEKGELL